MRRPDTDRLLGTEEAMARGIMELLEIKKDRIKTLTDLNDEEIGFMALLQTMSTKLNVAVIGDFVDNFCRFRVSRFRLGRREMSNIIAYAGGTLEDKHRKRSVKDLFSGIR